MKKNWHKTTYMLYLYTHIYNSFPCSSIKTTITTTKKKEISETTTGVMVALDSARTGRLLQRYKKGRRLVVGCIPYRFKTTSKSYLEGKELEVLLISAQREGKGMLFPKGGWENDESMKEAALRETIEEAGVLGIVQQKLGKWKFKSKSHDGCYVAYMFPLLVKDQLDLWPEKEIRRREWMGVSEAREACHYTWMKEALDSLACRLVPIAQQQMIEEIEKVESKQQYNNEEEVKHQQYSYEEVEKIENKPQQYYNCEEVEKVESKPQQYYNCEEIEKIECKHQQYYNCEEVEKIESKHQQYYNCEEVERVENNEEVEIEN